ncbi:hypothetical protein ACFE04_028976 [Oxalis oulophora]
METHALLTFIFGMIGNITSFIVILAPLPTFYRIVKKKSTEGFQSIPYIVALFSAMLWLFYASQKSGVFLLVIINVVGCAIETIYIALYIAYAPKQSKMYTMRLLILVNFGGFCAIMLLTHFISNGPLRVEVLGWICVIFATSVFAAPLSIMRLVIRTKSVEFMPLPLSVCLTMSAFGWLFYGIFLKDMYIMAPNVLGVLFGVIQIALYMVYRNKSPIVKEVTKLPEHQADIVKVEINLGDIKTEEPKVSCSQQNVSIEINKLEEEEKKMKPNNMLSNDDMKVEREFALNGGGGQPILCGV